MKRKLNKEFNFKKIINEELYGNKSHLFENTDEDEEDDE